MWYTSRMKIIDFEQEILKAYIPHETTLREVARQCETNHHMVKRVLQRNNISIWRGRQAALSEEHKAKIGKSSKGRPSYWKGKKMPMKAKYKNMAAHLRYHVGWEWLTQFEDFEKLKALNGCINKPDRFPQETAWYKDFITHFYNDKQFNLVYKRWMESKKQLYKKPSIDHITPQSKGGTHDMDNLQVLSWFENRCKNNMTQHEWNNLKVNIQEHFV